MAKRTLRSGTVVLGGVGLLAMTLTACGSDPDKRCVDRVTYKTLPKYECGSKGSGNGTYYYGGSVRNGKVSGGSFNKSSVSRGGFGSSHSSGG